MPKYTVESPDGRKVDLEGDSPPNEQELEQIFAAVPGAQAQKADPLGYENDWKANYVADQNKGIGQKAYDAIGNELKTAYQIGKSGLTAIPRAIGGISDIIVNNVLKSAITGSDSNIGKDIVDAGGEGARRIGFDLLNQARTLPEMASQTNPVQRALNGLVPKTSPEEVQAAFDKSEQDKAFQDQGKSVTPYAGNEQLAGAVADLPNTLAVVGAVPEVTKIGSSALGSLRGGATPEAMVQSAIRPLPRLAPVFQQKLKLGLPEMVDTGIPLNSLENASEAAKVAKQQVWKQVKAATGNDVFLDGDQIAAKIQQVADSPYLLREARTNPKIQALREEIMQKAEAYKGQIAADEAESILQTANQKTGPIYDKSKKNFRALLAENPMAGADVVLADAIRAQLYPALEKATGIDVKTLKLKYGALDEIGSQADRRIGFENNKPPADQIGKLRHIVDAGKAVANFKFGNAIESGVKAFAPDVIKNYNSLASLLSRADDALNSPAKGTTTISPQLAAIGNALVTEALIRQRAKEAALKP